ncbi:hypothetical protein LOK82_02490 [Xylella fastidiosa subsp. multiplex]|uniref:Uncharacterized protein n=1 Tax=Xylella fastidiosa subsp. multiplex TaxID=644357 RepID=A0AAW6HS16_XYLFS|nr:hypothetical protein [Xylella fastidiosa subsp. multiplex]
MNHSLFLEKRRVKNAVLGQDLPLCVIRPNIEGCNTKHGCGMGGERSLMMAASTQVLGRAYRQSRGWVRDADNCLRLFHWFVCLVGVLSAQGNDGRYFATGKADGVT